MEIRAEQDPEAVRRVHAAAFGPGHGETVGDLVDALRLDPDTLSLTAVEDGEIVGHIMFSPARLDAPRRLVEVRTLSPLGVLPAYQRRGFGLALIRHGLDLLDRQRVPLVFLEGDPAYYRRAGFLAGEFRKPSLRIPDAAFQHHKLAAYEPWMTGTLVYPDVFWRFDVVGLRP